MSDCCGGTQTLIMGCSGTADVGELSDKVYRKLVKDGLGSGFCLAGVGADISGFVESAKVAENIVIDGCPVNCGKKLMESRGAKVKSFTLTSLMGLIKGKTAVTDELIGQTAEKLKECLTSSASDTKIDPVAGGGCSCGGNC